MDLSRRDRRKARRLARQCWMQANGDEKLAEDLFRAEAPNVGIDPILIATVVYYAIKLFIYWRSRRKENTSFVPALHFTAGEPFFEGADVESKEQLFAALATGFNPAVGDNQLTVLGRVVDVIKDVLPKFLGSKADAMATIERVWDEVVVPYDIPQIPELVEVLGERALRPVVLGLAEKILDQLGVE